MIDRIATVLLILFLQNAICKPGLISIRGHSPVQHLPTQSTNNWPTWTYHKKSISRVEDPSFDSGWVNPCSFENLYFPSDLPYPLARPSLGVVIASGTARYIMPSIILTLETPDRIWRNRGICSLPRANAWIDIFSRFSPSYKNLRLYSYGQEAPDVRFLEDQDGSFSWDSIHSLGPSERNSNNINYGILRGDVSERGYSISDELDALQEFLRSRSKEAEYLQYGYHFIDIPIFNALPLQFPKYRIKQYLTDLDDPKRLIDMEDALEELDAEPIGELDIKLSKISPGGTSEFLPEAYFDLYEQGNIVDSNFIL